MTSVMKRILVSATALTSVTAVWAFSLAQPFDDPLPPICPGDWTFQVESVNDEIQFENPDELASSGTPIFGETEVVRPDDGPDYVQRRFEALEGKGHDPAIGTITWTLDRDRQAEAEDAGEGLTTVTANQEDGDLPASADIRFYVQVTLESLPDRVFKSDRQVRFVSKNITTYPFRDEQIEIAEPVDFVDEDGQVVFRILSGTGTATSEG